MLGKLRSLGHRCRGIQGLRPRPGRRISAKRLKGRFFSTRSFPLGLLPSGAVLPLFATRGKVSPGLVPPPGGSASMSLTSMAPLFSIPLGIRLVLLFLIPGPRYKVYIYTALPWHLAGATVCCNGFVQPHTECTPPRLLGGVRHLCSDLGQEMDVSRMVIGQVHVQLDNLLVVQTLNSSLM